LSYTFFADYYDALTDNVSYDNMADFICKIFQSYGKSGSSVLDVACGTGTLTLLLAERGYDMIGADRSFEMLSTAQQKAFEKEVSVLFLNQSAERLDLYGTVEGVVCTLDSLNHITDNNRLLAALKRISLFIEPGGIFIFDVNTVYKHNSVLANNVFVYETDDVMCVWQNNTYFDKALTEIRLDFFSKADSGFYVRNQECFSERGYTCVEMQDMLRKAGFEILEIYDNYTENKPSDKTERLVYVTKKI